MRSRNLTLLVIAQALAMSGSPAIILLGGIVGGQLAPNPGLATLPISIMVVGAAVSALPAGGLMRRVGRRNGFLLASLLAIAGAALAALALQLGSFWLFCLATLLIGANNAFVQQYRFAAAESVESTLQGRAVALVLVGGIFAGFAGPEIARRTQDWLAVPYQGSFVALVIVYALVLIVLAGLQDTHPTQESRTQTGRPLGQIMRQPDYLLAVLAGASAYGVMSFVMTATPVHMHGGAGFSLDQTTLVIQSHIIAMYLPSLISGFLIERLGLYRFMLLGGLLMLACSALAMISSAFMHYWWALVLLGLGWNLLFVGGTVLLTRSYAPEERFKTQASNDFVVFGVQALGSLSAGSMLHASSWSGVNRLSMVILLLTLGGLVAQRRRLASPA
ncbi:MAG: MFS transporter [Anaerolineales bacterium]|nr:MFS transporter [Anaerolineales bacterium]